MGRRDRESEVPGGKRSRRKTSKQDIKEEKRALRAEKKRSRKGNRQIVAVSYCVVAIFLCMIGYLVQFMVRDSQEIINNPANKRQELLAKKIIRGEILSADGKVLAETVINEDGQETRHYPYGRVFCHVVGRTQNSKTGIEQDQSFPLLTSHVNPLAQLANEFRGEKNQGDTVVTTLDADLQQAAYDALGSQKGAIVAIEPSTGKILAMVSKPDYDPETVLEQWDSLVEDVNGDSALLNRATQGLYPPGSTFKILTALEYMLESQDYKKYQYTCTGSDSFGGNVIRCYDGEQHGTVNLTQSLAHSCNGSFATLGLNLNVPSFQKLCKKFGFNRELSVDFTYNKSKFVLNEDSDAAEVAQTAIGQGKTQITPLENAIICQTIANDGVRMTPYLVDYVKSADGRIVTEYSPEKKETVITKKMANQITKMMKSVVTDGTATALRYLPCSVAGKTGTAEFDSEGNSHAWFVGFAPAKNPKIAISIIVEGAGTGSRYAVPIAKTMLENYVEK